ncbi:MAG: hypothetical protein V3R51_06935 [Gammaproteobacteria bacterium]
MFNPIDCFGNIFGCPVDFPARDVFAALRAPKPPQRQALGVYIMLHTFISGFVVAIILGLSGCAATVPLRNFGPVPPGEVYPGKYMNITAPKSEGWSLIGSSTSGMVFARNGDAPNESFAAQVIIFDLRQTKSPEDFEALIVRKAGRDLETRRFTTKDFSHQYSDARGYPCVQAHNVTEDRQARTGPNKTETLVMENEHLYCRHPTLKNTGFVIQYSHRGSTLYPKFNGEARAFIEGVQVPNNQSAPSAP